MSLVGEEDDAGGVGMGLPSELDEKIRNFTGILQNKFPSVNINDIPGLPIDGLPSTGANFLLFMLSLVFGMFWITYITFFNSRIVGKIVTAIANKFVSGGYVKIGSLSWAVLPGKIMFRDVCYVTVDYTIRIQDGYVVFRWWRRYVPKDVTEDHSHSDTRVSLQLNGLEVHTYNRTKVYRDLERVFGYENSHFDTAVRGGRRGDRDYPDVEEESADQEEPSDSSSSSSAYFLGKNWRDLIPVIKVDMSSAKLVFGNRLLPTTLVVSAEEAHCTYSTKPAGCSLDHFMHFIKVRAENFKVLLASSPKYTGLRDEAPRFMGEGFVVVSSNEINLYYYFDEAGLVPLEHPDGGKEHPLPEWGIDIKCGKGTAFSYGPWADRQREIIYKFFFPPDYQPMKVTPEALPGEKRRAKHFVLRLSTEYESTLDVLFSKQKETSAVHVNLGQGTNFELRLPWFVEDETGYTSTITGTLMLAEATTSLPYRELLQAETLEFRVAMHYPLYWNDHQEWLFSFVATKVSFSFIFAVKWFFQDLIDDWSSKSPPDLLYFVPYVWKFKFQFKKFELLTPTNEFNWIDTSSTSQENSYMAICGDVLNLSFDLPYTEFLPNTIPFNFDIMGENLDLCLFLPETNTSHDILYSLDANAKIATPEGKWKWKKDGNENKWRNLCKYEDGWIDCIQAPSVILQIEFVFHPMPLSGPAPQADVPTPEKEKKLLTPLRAPTKRSSKGQELQMMKQPSFYVKPATMPANFAPDNLEADKCSVKLYIGKGTAFLYGTLIRSFLHLKENLFGEDQHFTAMDSEYAEAGAKTQTARRDKSDASAVPPTDDEPEPWDPRPYRPIEVILDLSVNNLQAHLIKNCSVDDLTCPFMMCEQIGFEMDKKYRETRLQLVLSPVKVQSGSLSSKNKVDSDGMLSQGHLLLTGLQFRGHAMFSELDRRLGSDTLEYAWLIEVQCGSLIGKITPAQLYHVFVWLETFAFLAVDKENVLKHPRPYKICQHNVSQKECSHSRIDKPCNTVEDLKYRLVRFLVDSVDVQIVEKTSALRLQSGPLRLATCNLHGLQTKQGVTALVKQVQLKQYISSNFPLSRSDTDTNKHHQDIWIESGSVCFGPVFIEGAMSGGQSSHNGQKDQSEFLQKHDNKTRKLWFLWPQALTKIPQDRVGKCGCSGGCNFFGQNSNGVRFFYPEKSDLGNRKNVAIPSLRNSVDDPGYGQSILADNQLVVQGYTAFGIGSDLVLPEGWPHSCREPVKLPFCPDYHTHKSSSSHNSSDTPKHPKYHRSFSGKHGTPLSNASGRKRSVASALEGLRPLKNASAAASHSRLSSDGAPSEQHREGAVSGSSNGTLAKASSLIEVQGAKAPDSESSREPITRTESLVSDVLSFYSMDGEDTSSKVSFGLSSPRSLESPESGKYELARGPDALSSNGDGASSPLSSASRYMSAASSQPASSSRYESCSAQATSPGTSQYETASQGSRTYSSMSFDSHTLQPDSPANLDALLEDGRTSDTISDRAGASSGSFISAVSDHADDEDDEGADDIGLVNLHMQVNKPITDSPLLMSSYISHLTQLRCGYWNEPPSSGSSTAQSEKPQVLVNGTNGKILADFDMLEEGFSVIKMCDKKMADGEEDEKEELKEFDWDAQMEMGADSEFVSSLSDCNTSKTTIIVNFKGAIDIICCPIMLESVEKMADSLVTTFQGIHPISVVNHLHAQSVDRVESRNTLKKEKSLDLQEKLVIEPAPKNSKDKSAALQPDMYRTFEKSISSYVQASLNLPKVNVMVLQASVVEEMCAFSALDHVKDITCVSLLSLGIKETRFQLCKTAQSKKTVQMYLQNQSHLSRKKKKSKYKMTPDLRQNEPFTFESSETQREEILMTGSIDKVHAQLRRLRNDSSILQDAAITAIPNHKSKVFFDYVNVPRLSHHKNGISSGDGTLTGSSRGGGRDNSETTLGYNMCECGLEGISLKVAKRSCNQDNTEVQKTPEPTEPPASASETTSVRMEHETPTRGTEAPLNREEAATSRGDGESVSNAGSIHSAPEHEEQEKANAAAAGNQGRRSTASGFAELNMTWFNFAAPPKTPISKKIDFTKLDWNLLSTASPSIDAWLGPMDRMQMAASRCMNQYHQRVGAAMACLMAEALDVAAENFLKLTKYEKLTALSKTLRDDPSCQLCSILLKYMMRDTNLDDIKSNLDPRGVPPLTTLRQGIVVLSRQWKNALYTPILIEYNLRCRSLKNIYGTQMNLEPVNEEPYDESEEDDEDFDEEDPEFGEETMLLKGNPNIPRFTLKNGSIISDISASLKNRFTPAYFSPHSDELLLFNRGGGATGGPARLFDARASVTSAESNDYLNSVTSDVLVNSGDVSPTGRDLLLMQQHPDESLYDWMKRQQMAKHQKDGDDEEAKVTITVKEKELRAPEEEVGANPFVDKAPGEAHITPQQTKSMHLLDAHIIFEPLLSSLGLMPQQIQNLSLKNLGSNVSILGSINEFKVDIIESEFGKRVRSGGSVRQHLSDPDPSPAFLCEKIYLQIDFKKMTDITSGGGGDRQQREKMVVPPLYMTRAQLKRHTSSLVNFSIDVHFISQKVNMPLLRLVNQIATMHQNVKETNEELKENKPTVAESTVSAGSSTEPKFVRGHKKSSSGSSTSSNLSNVPAARQNGDQSFSSETGASGAAATHRMSESSISKRPFQTTPSPSMTLKSQIRNRPKSFAQKFRPNSRLAGLSNTVNLESPAADQHDSFILTSAPLEMITEEQTMIRCWKTMYNLLELYSTMPTTKTVQRQSLTPLSNVNVEAGLASRGQVRRVPTPTAAKDTVAINMASVTKTPEATADPLPKVNTPGEGPRKTIKEVSFAKADLVKQEHTPIIVFGIAKIRRTKLTAVISGLKLEGDIKELQTSMQYREKIRTPMKGVVEASVIGNMQETNLVLLEGRLPKQQTVVKVTVGKTQVIHTSHMWKTKDKNCGTLSVDLVQVEIPQHPVDLHSIVTRGTKELSSTLQEFRGARILQRGKTMAAEDLEAPVSQQSPKVTKEEKAGDETDKTAASVTGEEEKSRLIKPFVMQFNVNMHKLVMSAALLPSLRAEYSMENLTSKGMTGEKAKFVIDLPKHTLSFNTKLQDMDTSEANLPSEASIDLPKVQVSAEYIQDEGVGSVLPPGKKTSSASSGGRTAETAADGSILSQGSYLSAEAEIGELEHSLTTDLLNHLVFVQKVFMKEVNEVVQKMSGTDKPVPVWTEFGEMELQSTESKRLLYSVVVRLKNITITATTPANSGVRFETGLSELHISNRVQNMRGSTKEKYKVFTKAMVNLKLSLGQLIRDSIYYEAEPQFQVHAYFKTTVHLRNAFQGETVPTAGASDTDLICITLNRPLIFVQPIAVDRAILFWLSYKNAWEYWTEQRLNLNKEVLAATEQVLEKVPITQITSQLSAQHVGTLFLQLNVQDIGLCIPLSLDTLNTAKQSGLDSQQGAIVATVESSSISSCSARSTVSKGKFKELCIRFTDDFNHFLDDWKPDKGDAHLMNLCLVSEGSYEICSQTEKAVKEENAKWLLNVKWQMTGVDVHVDTNIGKHLSALGHTLTTLTGEEEEDGMTVDGESVGSDEFDDFDLSSSDDLNVLKRQKTQQIDLDLPPFLFDPNLDKNVVAKYLEHEINEQAKTVEDLQKLGASEQTIAAEMKKLNELQNIASKNFRQDLVERIRRQKSKASYFKEKFGLGSGSTAGAGGVSSSSSAHRLGAKSKSIAIPSPTSEESEFLNTLTDKKKKSPTMNFASLSEEVAETKTEFQRRPSFVTQHSTIQEDEEDVDGLVQSPASDDSTTEEDRSESERRVSYESDVHFPRDAKKFSLSPVKQRESLSFNTSSSNAGISGAAAAASGLKAAEPNVDFEFHVNIIINSGKCVLHTLREEEREKRRMKKDRSFSGNVIDSSSPSVSRKGVRAATGDFKTAHSSTRLREMRSMPAATDITTFYIPGLDVRVHYMSKTDDMPLGSPESTFQRDISSTMVRKSSSKKGVLTTWMTLQSIPEETIITPVILVFLEQALEPLPTFNRGPAPGTGAEDSESVDPTSTGGGDSTSGGSQTGLASPTYSSFPVDVIVYFHMQSSTFRFSCLPVSRVECMLRLPSLDLVFSSKRADGEIMEEFGDISPNKPTAPDGPVRQSTRLSTAEDNSILGGMSITGCLSDFSLYVFHPYGGGRRMRPEEMNFSPLTSEERKDSLSVQVAFVKFHISRSRKLNFDKINLESSQRFSARQSFSCVNDKKSMTCVRFSTVIDIGSASFKYDMRRLSEILAFPKAWYRRTLVRRLFLGEFKTTSFHSENAASVVGAANVNATANIPGAGNAGRKASLVPGNATFNAAGNKDKRSASISQPENAQAKIWIGQTTAHSWETLVMTAINFKELKVHMNMGNVMGNVDWISKDFRSSARLSIASTGHKNMQISLGLNGSNFEAKAGIVGGSVNVGRINTICQLKEDKDVEPYHKLGLQLDAVEVRFDYMGTSVMMGRISNLNTTINDDWHVTDTSSMRPAQIFVRGDLFWDQLQVMISKSTTADLLKIANKLEEFFSQQFKDSKKLFSSLEPGPRNTRTGNLSKIHQQPREDPLKAISHHRHWQRAMRKISGMKIYTLPFKLPDMGSVLGGVLELRGNHISVACFHGINFKSKSWALFSLKDPSISFVSDAQEILEEVPVADDALGDGAASEDASVEKVKKTNVIQTLSFFLGQSSQPTQRKDNTMATVKKISRSVNYLPPIKSLTEWFNYAFKSSELDEVHRFPSLSGAQQGDRGVDRDSRAQQRTEDIFALPCLKMDLKTIHMQGDKLPTEEDPKPVVDCTFFTDFENHIYVTTDAEAFFFLHDIISSYVKEKERVLSIQQSSAEKSVSASSGSVPLPRDKSSRDKQPIDPLQNDWRQFECNQWHLEPTVRLISWAGSEIEPYGVDYILQRLGFSHARTTIPKWLQRGCMDPLDKICSLLVLRAVQLVQEEKNKEEAGGGGGGTGAGGGGQQEGGSSGRKGRRQQT